MAESQARVADRTVVGVPAPTVGPITDVPEVARRLSGLAVGGELVAHRQRSLWGDAWRRLLQNKMAVAGLFVVSVFTLIAVFAPLIAPYAQSEVVDYRLARTAPTWLWPMGLDQNGRDIFSRLVYGARVSLVVGVLSQLLILAIGLPIGALAGYYGGKVDNFIMRSVDVVYAVPQILLVMVFLNIFGPGLVNIFIAIGLIGWVTLARLVRGQFLALREQEYVNASKVAGAGGSSIIIRHLMPNSLTPVIVSLTFGIPTAIFTEAALSFVGVGILPPQASWGQMVGDASHPGFIMTDPFMLLFPVLAIGLTMLGFTFLGDGLRDALDVRGSD
ncbi:MAG: ABC transporter permease [Chloroflexia bacterium]|nr:ABC transporter permease [Chloroflexia bacterium]